MTINEKIKTALDTITTIPNAFLRYNGNATKYIVYSSSYNSSVYADDDEEYGVYSVTVTIFSDSNYLNTIDLIKTTMTANGFVFDEMGVDMFDEETSLFYKAIYFKIENL